MSKLITQEEAKKITSKHIESAKQVEESGKMHIESEFYDIDIIKELIEGVPVKSIKGVRVKFGVAIREGKESLTTVLELVTKDSTKTSRFVSDPPPCPTECR